MFVTVLAALLVAGGLLSRFGVLPSPWPRVSGSPWWLVFAGLVVAIAQLARLSVRAGNAMIKMAWGEAAIVILCATLPTVWIPAVVLVGVAIGHSVLACFGRARFGEPLLYSATALTVAGSAAALVAAGLGPAVAQPLSQRQFVVLIAAAATYSLVGALLLAIRHTSFSGGGIWRTFADMLSSKLPMIFGNVMLGLLVVVFATTDWRYLALLVPVFWLLHQTFGYRMRGDDERRMWQVFAEATAGLNRLDERDAAFAGIRGAALLFQATGVEVVVRTPSGHTRRYVGGAAGGGPDGSGEPREVDVDTELPGWERTVVRPLLVGGVHVGLLRLLIPGPGQLRPRDHLIFGAYGDALAAALHDAVTHDELVAMGERSSYDAVHDQLTGLANRSALLDEGDATLDVLRLVARRLAAVTGPGELIARLGGDEFALLGPLPAESLEEAHADAADRARGLCEVIAQPVEVAGVAFSVETSVGVVVARAGEVDVTQLLRRADIAVYEAKHLGQSVATYDSVRDHLSADRLALLAEVREALLADDQFSLVVQPVVSLTNGMPVGAEALIRWRHPRRGELRPDDFVPLIEQSELIDPFTRYVLDNALAVAAEARAAGLDLPISVNLCPRSLQDATLPSVVQRLLRKHRLPADRLVLEITESVVMAKVPIVDKVLDGLRSVGVQLSVDDFGTGYSTFTFLTRVPVEEIKIDGEFVRAMEESPTSAAIVRTTVALARELGLRVVAEGVETTQQRARLVELGCTAAQGHLLYRPVPAEDAVRVLRHLQPNNLRRLRQDDTA